jgi:hypothetical protein
MRISFSQVSMFQRCPEQYRRRYVEKEIIPPAVAMVKGTAVHKAAENNHRQKVVTRTDITRTDVVDIAVETLRATVKNEGLFMDADERARGQSAVMVDAESSVLTMAGLYIDRVAPTIQPAAVELEQVIAINGAGDELSGRIDTVTDDQHIVELKTARKKMSDADIAAMMQPTFYAALYRVIRGVFPAGVRVARMVDTKTPDVQDVTTTRNDDDVAAMIPIVQSTVTAVKAEAFTYAYGQIGAWWCSPKMCGYWSTCPAVPKYKR